MGGTHCPWTENGSEPVGGDVCRFIVEHASDISLISLVDGTLTYVSPQISRYGLDAAAALGSNLLDIVHPDDRERVSRDFKQAVSSGAVVTTAFRAMLPSGGETWFEGKSEPHRDSAGAAPGLTCILRDVTEQRSAEEKAKRAEAVRERAAIIDALTDGVALVDEAGKLVLVNPALVRMTGYEAGSLVGEDCVGIIARIMDVSCRDAAIEEFRKALRGDASGSEQYLLVPRRGSKFPVDCTVSFLSGGARGQRCVVLAVRDITRTKEAEQELRNANILLSDALTEVKRTQQQIIRHERLSAIGQMASGITHDFNNALMAVMGFSELFLKMPELLDDRKEALSMIGDIHSAAKDAAETIRRLRDFYRPPESSGRKPTDVNKLLESAIALTQPRWKKEAEMRSIAIELKTQFGELPPAMANESQLREAVTNLLLNAIDAMPAGGALSVATSVEGRRIVIEIRDTGTGMTEEVRKRCFEPFFSTKGVLGTGLGLSVTHGIIRQHGGTIDVSSQLGKGAMFTIRLPTAEARAEGEAERPLERREVAIGPLKVLAIDDEAVSRDVICRILRSGKHEVDAAESGKEGLKKFRERAYDLVITDRAMPDMSGDEVALAVKSLKPDVPVVLVTGFGDLMLSAGERPEGIDEIVSKPVVMDDFCQAVERAMSRHRPGG